jgi:outer membrane protein OmpA-like peptidoglycan-associated protein
VAASKVTSQGRGKSEAVADNDTEEGRALNRRVELHLN